MDQDSSGGGRSRGKRGIDRAWRLLTNALSGFSRHRGTQLAASMAYYALFSVFPAAIVVAAAAGFILDDPGAREDAINFLLEELPLSDEQGRTDIEKVLDGVTSNSGTIGLIGLIALMITASALISAARNSVNTIFGDDVRRGALRGKGLDLLLVLGVGLLFALSFGMTLVGQLDPEFIGDLGRGIIDATGEILPVVLTAVVFGVLYRVLPTEHPRWRDIWPGIVFASIGYELLQRGFSIYVDNFANYSAVYGSLGTVIAFMFFVYLGSIVFLLGAEMAAIWPGVRAGSFDPDPDQDGPAFGEQLRSTVRGLFARNPTDHR